MAVYSLNICIARFGGNQDYSSTDREVRSIYIYFLVNYFGHCPSSHIQGDSNRTKHKYSAIDHITTTLITFQMPVSSWAFHVDSSRESFVKFTLGGRL
jgi:hypothetical protein